MRGGTRTLAIVLTLGLSGSGLVAGTGSAAEAGKERTKPGHVAGPRAGTPADIARDHLQRHAERYGVTAADVSDLVVASTHRSDHTGVTHVYLEQRIDGLRVAGSSVTVNVAPDGSIVHVGSALVPNLFRASGRAVLGPAEAAAAAAGHLDLEPTGPFGVLEVTGGGARTTLLSDGGISLSPIPARLVYQALEDGRIRLAWSLEIEEVSQEHWWNVSVDAETGAVLATTDYVDHEPADGSSYRVFALPLESPNDGARTLVAEPGDALASPFGWHDTNGQDGAEFTTTQGNNAHAYIDTANTGLVGVVIPGTDANGGPGLDFDFPWNPDLPPTANKDSAVTNLFYWNNIIHDVFYRYGFTEGAGNFQVNNYGRGGAGNDSVRAEAQDGSGVNNANFATPADGSRPRMQMFVWTTGVASQRRIIDGDVDAGVIVHEYGHGISNRLTGGRTNVGCLGNQEQMGEGWSDWLAIALTALPTESGPQRRGMGTYVLAQPNRQGNGIRPTPYSTDMSINPSTYDTIKTASVPHGVGYVWATVLWEVFWNLVDKHGFNPEVYGDWTTGGNNLAIQLVMDGMKMQPCRPGFVDGRDAILAADLALTGGVNQCEIWQGFAKRGLGVSAVQGSSASRADGTQAFDLPGACAVEAEVTPSSLDVSVREGATATETLTVANLATEEEEEPEFTGDPQETIEFSFGPEAAPAPGAGTLPTPQSTFEFEVSAPPEADNDAMVASLSWQVPSDYDLHLERKVGEDWVSHGCQCAFVNNGEQVAATSPQPGTWRVRLENWLAAPQSVSGSITFSSNPPSPPEEEPEEETEADLLWSITEAESDCGASSDLGWVSASPTEGVTGPSSETEVSVVFDASGLVAPGLHTGLLCVSSNDTQRPTIEVSVSLQVLYPFEGFFGAAHKDLNRANAGATVPLVWSLGGDRGLDILKPGSPSSVEIDCATGEVVGSPAPTQAQGPGLTYNPETDRYTYRWRTLSAWQDTCRRVTVALDDGSEHAADFRFK